ncbi:hypothetical protein BCR42DRAFT_427351, partial [Absidia repens]
TDLSIDVLRVLIIGIVQVSQSVDKKTYMEFVIFPPTLKNYKLTILLWLLSTLKILSPIYMIV